MKMEKPAYGLILTVVGLVLSVVGMVSYTGILKLGLPSAVMYAGFVVTVAGLVILYADLRENAYLLEDIDSKGRSKR